MADYTTNLVMENATPYDITVSAAYAAPSDWGKGNPAAFQNLAIAAGTSSTQSLIVAEAAKTANLTLTVTAVLDSKNKKVATLTIRSNQRDAITPPAGLTPQDITTKQADASKWLKLADDWYAADIIAYPTKDFSCDPADLFYVWQTTKQKDNSYTNQFIIIQ